jgi:hypothetical protein
MVPRIELAGRYRDRAVADVTDVAWSEQATGDGSAPPAGAVGFGTPLQHRHFLGPDTATRRTLAVAADHTILHSSRAISTADGEQR